MSEELIIEQPTSEQSTWLTPKDRCGHLIAFFDCTSKKPRYDEKAKCDKDIANFRFVDLDAEREMFSGVDNHDGITRQLTVGNVAVVLGRIGTVKTKADNDFFVLLEHAEEDSAKLKAWYADWKAGKDTRSTVKSQPAKATPAPAGNGGFDLTKLDPTTLALIQAQLAQSPQ